MTGSFVGEEIAIGYARHRPPVRAHIFEIVEARAGALQVQRALDLGCGASLSPECSGGGLQVIGFDPSPAMLHWRKLISAAHFVAGAAEAVPLGNGTAELVTSAGSLNYAEPDDFFREAAPVLTSEGLLVDL